MVLNDSELAVEYSSLLMKQKKKYKYEDIKPCFGTGSVGGGTLEQYGMVSLRSWISLLYHLGCCQLFFRGRSYQGCRFSDILALHIGWPCVFSLAIHQAQVCFHI